MRHKHADLIHAWAEGVEIEMRSDATYPRWLPVTMPCPSWDPEREYRIKPEKKPDVERYVKVSISGRCLELTCIWCDAGNADLRLTFCGKTGKLIKAEVL